MKKRIAWLVVSGLVAVSLVLASCAPKVTGEKKVVTEEKKTVTEEKKVVTEEKKEVVAKEVEPQYGGWLNTAMSADPSRGFSRAVNFGRGHLNYSFVANESLVVNDPLKGPRGSGEWSMMYDIFTPPDLQSGALAESWEIIQPDTIIYHIRKGIHWQDKAPIYGAELTAEDVVYTFRLAWGMPGSTWPTGHPGLADPKNPEKSIYIHPDNPRAVVFKAEPGLLAQLWERVSCHSYIVSKALGDPKGTGPDTWSWKTVVGTGPFLLTDYVTGSSLTWQRNPNYWQKDPFRSQKQLPYLDGIKAFIIPDLSTQIAALRTGKIDILTGLEAEDAESLFRTNPELLFKGMVSAGEGPQMRQDVKPFDDVRVRRAMTMAINYQEMVEDYYKGKAALFWWPAYPIPEHSLMYVPLEQMPQSVQELYGYHLDKAKQLLAEAGYRDGFKTSIIVSSANEKGIDVLSIVKAYWAKVGVTLEIQVKEPAVYTTMGNAFSYEQGYYSGFFISEPTRFTKSRVGSTSNYARINDPLLEQTYEDVQAVATDWAEVSRIIKERAPELIMRAHHIRMPAAYTYVMWQPWLKDFNGEVVASSKRSELSAGYWVWIDQDLKQAMGRR